MGETIHLVVMALDAFRFAFPLEWVDRVYRAAEVTPLPEAPPTEAPPAAREKALPGFFVRGIYGGKAMVQTADGFVMVEPGKVIPGAGEVSRIERRGQEWVVVTTHGVIGQTPN